MAEPAYSLGFNVVDYIFVLYQFVQFVIVFNPPYLIFFRRPKIYLPYYSIYLFIYF